MMRGGIPWLLHEFPDVVDQKIVKSADLFLENFIGLHYRSQIAIVDAVKWIELNGVTLEMPGQEGLCHTPFTNRYGYEWAARGRFRH